MTVGDDPPRFGGYRLGPLLGRGGMGEVYRAFDTVRGRTVALKLLRSDLAHDTDFVQRFRREAEVASRLRDPHVVPIHDHGEIDGRLFIDMRLVDGVDLAVLLRAEPPLAPERAVGIVAQVASALDAAHADGLVHRDIKPSNVIVVSRPGRADFAYLVDFGVARDLAAQALTGTGVALGTVQYMAPEQFLGKRPDRRADVYSLACVLFETLTGAPPFVGDGLPSMIHAHLNVAPPRLADRRPDLPPALEGVLARGLAKRPEDRHAGAGELAAAAAAALRAPAADLGGATVRAGAAPVTAVPGRAAPQSAAPVTATPGSTPAPSSGPIPAAVPTPPRTLLGSVPPPTAVPAPGPPFGRPPAYPPAPPPRRRAAWWVGGVALVAALAVVVVLVLRMFPSTIEPVRTTSVALSEGAAQLDVVAGGTLLVAMSEVNGKISIIDRASGSVTTTLTDVERPVDVVLSPVDPRLGYVVGQDGWWRFDPVAGTLRQLSKEHRQATAFSADGRTLFVVGPTDDPAFTNDMAVYVLDPVQLTVRALLPAPGRSVSSLAVAPDGSRIYLSDFGHDTITRVDVGSRTVVGTVGGSRELHAVVTSKISPDGRLLYVPTIGGVDVIDTTTLAPVRRLDSGSVSCLTLGPGGTDLYVCTQGKVVRWRVGADPQDAAADGVLKTYSRDLAVLDGGRALGVLDSDGLRILELEDG